MSILTATNVGQSFGDFDVFVGVSATIANDAKIGLVGPNGAGKTTLLRVLAGVDTPSAGSVTVARDASIGYLRQEAMQAFAGRDNTVHAEMLTVFQRLRDDEAALRTMEAQMAGGNSDESLFKRYSAAQQRFELAGGYDYEVRIAQTLEGLGFARDDWDTPLDHLSGGQKTRALLARLLLERPDLLILDEPTNHLDVQAVEWLESTLRTWPGALLIVSHDRYFLDRVADRIWEMSRSGVESYRGNYSAYLTQREERWARRLAEFEAVQEKFLKELDYIKRNIARDSTRNQAVGRMKRLVREVRVVEAGGLDLLNSKNWGQVMDEVNISSSRWSVMDLESAIKGLKPPIDRSHVLNMRLQTKGHSVKAVLRSKELIIGYPGVSLFESDPLALDRGACAALIGPNGTGKTTFLRTLLKQVEPLSGTLTLGAGVRVGYFAQAHERLNLDNTVLDELIEHKHLLLEAARRHLAQYMFRGDDVFKRVGDLSGGERGRLALAILALEGANFLLLDEPTNHLDIPAQEALQSVLEAFPGTILMVSHDRYLIDRLATQIWHLHDGRLHVHKGNYSSHLAAQERARERERTAAAEERSSTRQDERQERRSKNSSRKQQRALAEAEERVHALEQRLELIEAKLGEVSAAQQVEHIQRLSQAHAQTQNALEAAMDAWAELEEAVAA